MTKIKICGLRFEEEISFANELAPDFIGFVFLKGRRRYVSPERAADLRALLRPSIQSVGVFVDEPLENVAALLQGGTIGMAQLHGKESPAYAQELKQMCGSPIVKAFVIKSKSDIEEAAAYPADYLLLDNGLGTGESFDWSLVQGLDRPFFLAGGLTSENVSAAISAVRPYAVDVSSGVETECKKDYNKIKAFINSVRKS